MPVIDHKFYKDRIAELEAQNKMMREALLNIRTLTSDIHQGEYSDVLLDRVQSIRFKTDDVLQRLKNERLRTHRVE